MAAISFMGLSLPGGLILSNAMNSNMASSVLTNSKQEAINISKTFSKITVQNVLSENNGNSINISNNNGGHIRSGTASVTGGNAIVRKIKDFGMVGAVNNAAGNSSLKTSGISKSMIVRKRPLVESKNLSSEKNKPATPVPKKLKQAKETTTPKTAKKPNSENAQRVKKSVMLNPLSTNPNGLNVKPAGTPGRKGLPLPQAVARRNARERNRVKQVNNGFAALRERIPEEVAEAFESQGSTRGNTAKKLSKVETLRMAVEYIRSLERLLGFDFSINGLESGQNGSGSSGEDSYSLIKDEFDTLSPSIDENFDDSLSHYDMDDYFSTTSNMNNNDLSQAELSPPIDFLPDITTLNGLQYIRIPGTNTYQLLTPDLFVGTTHSPPNSSLDDEPFNALIDANCMSPTTPAAGLTTSPINANNSASPSTTTASSATPASPNIAATAQYGDCVSTPALSARLSPVPTHVQPATTSTSSSTSSSSTSSPDAGSSSSLYQHQQATVTLSPASTLINERTLQTCATAANVGTQSQFIAPTLPHLLPHFIKQEYVGDQVDFATATTRSPSSNGSNSVFQTTTAAGDQHATLSLSPPLDRCNRLLMAPHHHASAIELQSFYEQDDSGSFYDNNLSFKKDLNDVLLDASTATNAGLSDESMIEAIDWWEAHTPQT